MALDFPHTVTVLVDKKDPISFSHQFPVILPSGKKDVRWAKRPLAPKKLNTFLRGIGCKFRTDYLYTCDIIQHAIVYHFKDSRSALMLRLFTNGPEHTHTDTHTVTCPGCGLVF